MKYLYHSHNELVRMIETRDEQIESLEAELRFTKLVLDEAQDFINMQREQISTLSASLSDKQK